MNPVRVSCIMPTMAARRRFWPLAIENFLKQDYPNLELVILHDSDKADWQPILPADNRIRYYSAPIAGRHTGGRRNMACELATGEIIVHWDDDDWYAPDWISRQVALLENTGAAISGLDKLLFYAPMQRYATLYTYTIDKRSWVAGATMAYRKSLWEKRPFRDVKMGEDNDFVWNCGEQVAILPYLEGFVATIHPGNTSPKYTTTSKVWTDYPVTDIARILGERYTVLSNKDFFS